MYLLPPSVVAVLARKRGFAAHYGKPTRIWLPESIVPLSFRLQADFGAGDEVVEERGHDQARETA